VPVEELGLLMSGGLTDTGPTDPGPASAEGDGQNANPGGEP
jgi:hypothetical protein